MVAQTKLVMMLWEHRGKVLIGAALVLFVPMILFTWLTGFILANVPLVPDHLIPIYEQAAGGLRAPDGTPITGLAWQHLVAIDAVRVEQDFSRVTEGSIHELAQRFIKKVPHSREVCETIADPMSGLPAGEACHTEVTYTYELHHPETVMAALAFDPDQVAQAQNMMMLADRDTAPPGIPGFPGPPLFGDCAGFIPSPVGIYLWPAKGVITSCYGLRIDPVAGGEGFHTGIDIAAGTGTPIRAAQAGTVTTAAYTGNYGNLIVIQGTGIHTWYGHLSGYTVRSGQKVRQGDLIGYMGSTGKSTGPHLHFETRPSGGNPVDPRQYFR